MKQEKILTLHPAGKKGVNISREKYELVKLTIKDILRQKKEVTFTELSELVQRKLEKRFDGSISWYVAVVKLDLEARKIIECKRGIGLQKIRLSGGH